MSSIFNPIGSVVSATVPGAGFADILSSTNAIPIVVQTVSAHGFNTGDYVEVNGHLVNTNANGQWTISVVDSTHFSLNGSVGNGVGGHTGRSKDYSLVPVLQMPGDGDLASAAAINTPIEGAACAIPWLYRQCGTFRVMQLYASTFGDISSNIPIWSSTTTTSTSFVGCTSATALLNPATVLAMLAQDFLLVTVTFTAQANALANMWVTVGASVNGGAYGQQSGIFSAAYISGISTPPLVSFTLSGLAAIGPCNTFDFSLMTRSITGASATVQLFGGGSVTAIHYRAQGN